MSSLSLVILVDDSSLAIIKLGLCDYEIDSQGNGNASELSNSHQLKCCTFFVLPFVKCYKSELV